MKTVNKEKSNLNKNLEEIQQNLMLYYFGYTYTKKKKVKN
jgi:hypothetical protein